MDASAGEVKTMQFANASSHRLFCPSSKEKRDNFMGEVTLIHTYFPPKKNLSSSHGKRTTRDKQPKKKKQLMGTPPKLEDHERGAAEQDLEQGGHCLLVVVTQIPARHWGQGGCRKRGKKWLRHMQLPQGAGMLA
jgi:hypothetical protein